MLILGTIVRGDAPAVVTTKKFILTTARASPLTIVPNISTKYYIIILGRSPKLHLLPSMGSRLGKLTTCDFTFDFHEQLASFK